ncbi:MAG TPA: FHA domain-containing protein [Vicinamibacterales bacterium]|nr:FHA domain-containing protein [Vicinamibacterales bacterium]
MAKLVVFRGDSVEHELHVGDQTVRIGRDARNEVMLDDKAVTRFHAEVVKEGGTFYISDLNSRNGVWINRQRISGKVPLELGVPVTIGAYELTLEDDVGTSDFSEVLPAGNRTVVGTATVNPAQERGAAGSTTRGKAAKSTSGPPAVVRKPAVFWSAVGIGTLALCLLTYVAVRRLTARPAPPQVVENTTPPPPPIDPAPVTPAPATPLTQDIVAGYVEAAQYAIDDKDYQAASDDIDAALELDPTNQDLLVRQKQVQDLISAPPPVAPRPPPKPAAPEVPEVPGIPRRANEPAAEYQARAGRVQTNYRAAIATLDQDDFATAITRLQAVERDQKGYQNSDAMLADALGRQKKAVDTAIGNGQENERAGQLANAVRWYERALRLDPGSATAQEKLAGLADRRTKQGLDALNRADVFRKRNEIAKAVAAYQEAADLLPSTNDKKAEAQQWLEKLKQ